MIGSLSQIDRAEGRRRILGDRGLQRRTVGICLVDGYPRGEVTVALRGVPSLSDSNENYRHTAYCCRHTICGPKLTQDTLSEARNKALWRNNDRTKPNRYSKVDVRRAPRPSSAQAVSDRLAIRRGTHVPAAKNQQTPEADAS